jgi:hypothetical protein
MLLDLRVVWQRVALTGLTVACRTLRETKKVLCEFEN